MSSFGEAENEYVIAETEPYEAERQAIFLNLLSRDPDYAARWLRRLLILVAGLAQFPGPLAYGRDEEASDFYGYEVRRFLYYGPNSRRTSVPHRVLFTVLPQGETGEPSIIRVLRILHGAQQLVSNSNPPAK